MAQSERKCRQTVATEQQFTHVRHARRQVDRLQLVVGQVEVAQPVNSGERVSFFDVRQPVVGKAEILERAAESQ